MKSDPIFLKARAVVSTLQQAGYQAYFCGGVVRDMLLGVVAKDYDIVTSAEPAEVEGIFRRTVPVGKQFGVIRVMDGEDCFEVATFRQDHEYLDGRRPEGVAFGSIEDDAERRDFTINGMYYDPIEDDLVDLVGGALDLQYRMIRTIGDPQARFSEDYLRLLRAIRFACQLGFEIEDAAWEAIRANAGDLERISAERITAELERILTGPDPARGLQLLTDSGLLEVIAPELATLARVACDFGPDQPDTRLAQAILALTHLHHAEITLAMAVLCHALDEQQLAGVLGRLRLPGRTAKAISRLVADRRRLAAVELLAQDALKRILREDHAELLLELIRIEHLASDGLLGRYHELRLRLQRWRQEDSLWPAALLDGQSLVAMGYPRGPLFGQILRSVEDAQLRGELRSTEAATSWVRVNWKIVTMLWLLWLLPGCGGTAPVNPVRRPTELTAGQQTLNYAAAPLRWMGAALVVPLKLLLYDGPRGLWRLTIGKDDFERTLEATRSRDPAVRLRAAQAFRASAAAVEAPGRRLALAAALLRLLEDPRVAIANQAVLGLGQLGERWVVPRVVRLLKAPDDQLRGSAVIALAALGDARVGPLLLQLYDSPWAENWFVRAAVIQAAGTLSLSALLPRIRGLLDRADPTGSWLVQVVSIQAVGRLGDASDVARLQPLLRHENEYVRTAAAMSLGRLGRPDALVQVLPRASSARHQLPLILALGRHGRPADALPIGPLLDSPDPTVRAHAACALVDLGDPRGVEALIEGIQSQDVYERFVCLARLETVSGRDHGFEPRAWQAWWRDNRETVQLGRPRR